GRKTRGEPGVPRRRRLNATKRRCGRMPASADDSIPSMVRVRRTTLHELRRRVAGARGGPTGAPLGGPGPSRAWVALDSVEDRPVFPATIPQAPPFAPPVQHL